MRPSTDRALATSARFALVLLIAAGACASFRRSVPEDETDIVTVTVENHHQLNVAIYNVAQGHRDRLGDVTAAATQSFTLHTRRLPANELRLLADPIGSPRTATSELLRVTAGDTVLWTLETDLARSHIEIR